MPAPAPRRPSIADIRAALRALGDRRNPRPGDEMCAFGYDLAAAIPDTPTTARTDAKTTEPDDAESKR